MKDKEYRQNLVQRVTEQPASICPEIFSDFTIRGEGKTHVEWNLKMLKDNGVPTNRLRDICVVVENKAELMGLTPHIIKTY